MAGASHTNFGIDNLLTVSRDATFTINRFLVTFYQRIRCTVVAAASRCGRERSHTRALKIYCSSYPLSIVSGRFPSFPARVLESLTPGMTYISRVTARQHASFFAIAASNTFLDLITSNFFSFVPLFIIGICAIS